MAIAFSCPWCGEELKAPDDARGKSARCPGCGTPVACPGPEAAEAIGAADPAGPARRPCPECGEMIVATARKCRFCGELLDPERPPRKKKPPRSAPDDDNLRAWEVVLAVCCSFAGCLLGLLWLVLDKPKAGKLIGLSVAMIVLWNIILFFFDFVVRALHS